MLRLIWPLFLLTSFLLFSEERVEVKLTKEEVEGIKLFKKKEINVYLDNDLAILNYNNAEKSNGIYYQVITSLEELAGIKLNIVMKDKKDFEAALDLGIPDIVMGTEDYKRNRSKYYYLDDFIELNAALITRKDYPLIESNTELEGKLIAYIEEDQIASEVIKGYGSRLTLISKKNAEEAVESLLSGEVDIYVEDLQDSLRYLVKNPELKVKINYISPLLKTKYYIGGLQKNKPLVDIIEKILKAYSPNNKSFYKDILNYIEDKLEGFRDIKTYLKENSTLKVYVPENIEAYPIYYTDRSGNESGILVNYFYEIRDILGIDVVFQRGRFSDEYHINPNIIEINGNEIKSEEFLTTDPYYEFQFLIFNKKGGKYFPNLESLKKYKVAVQKESIEEAYLLYKGLEKNLITFDTEKEAIKAVSAGSVDSFIGGVKKTHYLLKKYNIKNIKVAGITEDKIGLKLGVSDKDETLYFLVNLFTKEFYGEIEERKEEFLEKSINITNDFKFSIFITIISIVGILAIYIYFKRFKDLYFKLTSITMGLVGTLENANAYNDEDTGDHIKRISEYSFLIGSQLKVSKKLLNEIKLYASLHDIGKIGIPDSILKKPGRLTKEEFEEMKKHTEMGYDLIKDLGVSDVALNIVRYHHEKWDGKGYGKGLKGEEIPLEARIVALVDVYDALRQKRVYKKPFTHQEAFGIIKSESGKHFDPRVVDIFLKNHNKFRDIFDSQSSHNQRS